MQVLLEKRISESSSVGRAQPCQGWGREFESRLSLDGLTSVSSSLCCMPCCQFPPDGEAFLFLLCAYFLLFFKLNEL
jgi:hypothetical protein